MLVLDVKNSMLLRNKVVNRATRRTSDFLLSRNNRTRATLFSRHCPPKFPLLVFMSQKPALSPRTQINQHTTPLSSLEKCSESRSFAAATSSRAEKYVCGAKGNKLFMVLKYLSLQHRAFDFAFMLLSCWQQHLHTNTKMNRKKSQDEFFFTLEWAVRDRYETCKGIIPLNKYLWTLGDDKCSCFTNVFSPLQSSFLFIHEAKCLFDNTRLASHLTTVLKLFIGWWFHYSLIQSRS